MTGISSRLAGARPLTTGEFKNIMGVSQQAVIRWLDNPACTLQGFRVPGSRFRRIPLRAGLEFIDKHISKDRRGEIDEGLLRFLESSGRRKRRGKGMSYAEKHRLTPSDLGLEEGGLIGNGYLHFHRYSSGLTTGEVAQALRVSQQTIIGSFDSSRFGTLQGFVIPCSKFRVVSTGSLVSLAHDSRIPLNERVAELLLSRAPSLLAYPGVWATSEDNLQVADDGFSVFYTDDADVRRDRSVEAASLQLPDSPEPGILESRGRALLVTREPIKDSEPVYEMILCGATHRIRESVYTRGAHLEGLNELLDMGERALDSNTPAYDLVRDAKEALGDYTASPTMEMAFAMGSGIVE